MNTYIKEIKDLRAKSRDVISIQITQKSTRLFTHIYLRISLAAYRNRLFFFRMYSYQHELAYIRRFLSIYKFSYSDKPETH